MERLRSLGWSSGISAVAFVGLGGGAAACGESFGNACEKTHTCAPRDDWAGGQGGEGASLEGAGGDRAGAGGGASPTVGGASQAGAGAAAGSAGDAMAGDSMGGNEGAPTEYCANNEYFADGICAPLTECGAGTYVSAEPTTATDRQCAPCAEGTFNRTLNAPSCRPWSTCGSDETQSVPPSPTSNRVCSTCGAGKYELNGECEPLTECGADEYESTAPTAKSDRACSALSTCDPGSKQTAAPTDTSDRQCAPCSSGTFSTQTNAAECRAWTVCGANQKQTMPGTSTKDAVCVDKPVCSTAADRVCSVDCPCASAEGVCTKDDQCESGATCVAGSGKKVGRTGNTCLATHCNNDKKDGTETSVDCGGECGCRATFETIEVKGVPAGATWGGLKAMSRDGKRFAADLGRNRTTYPAVVAADGTLTELPAYGGWAAVASANNDGNVMIGSMGCSNPPSCTENAGALVKWTGSAEPVVVRAGSYSPRGASASGSVIAGGYYDAGSSQQRGFIQNGGAWTSIPELSHVFGLTPDGKYVLGTLTGEVQARLWEAQTKTITKIGSTSWQRTDVAAINGTTPAVVGSGNIGNDKYVGFRWKSGTLTELGLLSGGQYTWPYAVSLDGGTVVGLTGTNDFQQAFIWTDKDKLRTIVDELVARGLEPPVDLKLTSARFMSDDGKTIVGAESTTPPTFWRVTLD